MTKTNVRWDKVMLSAEAATAWQELCERIELAITTLREGGRSITDGDITTTAAYDTDGTLFLVIVVKEHGIVPLLEAELLIPHTDWGLEE